MKICLLGGTGLLGSEFKKVFESQSLSFSSPTRAALDVTDRAALLRYLAAQAPSLVVNCVAYTDVDGAESDEESCRKLNVEVVETLVEAGTPVINFSTDYVFNAPKFDSTAQGVVSTPPLPLGEDQGEGFSVNAPSPSPSQREGGKMHIFYIPEDSPRDPQSVYAQSKADGEVVLESSNLDWWNIRTSWLWGPGGKNFVSTILELSKNRDELSIIDDQIGRPTYAPDLAEFVVEHFIIPFFSPPEKGDQGGLNLERENPSQPPLLRGGVPKCGHYHLQNQGEPISWAGLAEYFLGRAGWQGTIKKISTEKYRAPAARPKNSVMANTKLPDNLRDWRDAPFAAL